MSAEPTPIAAREVAGIGRLTIAAFDVARDVDHAHRWLTDPHAHYWGMTDNTPADTRRYFQAIADSDTHEAWIGHHDGRPCFAVELYDPAAEPVGAHYPVAAGDCGLHLLVARPTQRIPGFTWAIFSLVVDTLFARDHIQRLVVEPDIDNHGIHRLNARAGFIHERRIDMGDKIAWLGLCTRGQAIAAGAHVVPQENRS